MSWANHPWSLYRSPQYTSGFFALSLLVPPLKASTMCHTCSGFRSGVLLQDVVSPCCVVITIMFCRVLLCYSVSSYTAGDGGSGDLELGALSSLRALSNTSSLEKRSRFSAKGSMLSLLLVSIVSVYYVQLVQLNQIIQCSPLRVILAATHR